MINIQKSFATYSVMAFLLVVSVSSNSANVRGDKVPKIGALVSTEWLSKHLQDSNLVIVDTTVLVKMDGNGGFSMVSGHQQFEKEHIPNARFADLLGDLSATDTDLKFVMPSAEQWRGVIGELGIDNNSTVVLYDTVNQSWSERVWWMLRWAGHENVAILDGGMQAWKAEERQVSNKTANYSKKSFTLHLKPEMIADEAEVLTAIKDPKIEIVDALSALHYSGQFSMYSRAGHIATAINLDSAIMVDESGKHSTADEVNKLFNKSLDKRIITYCGGGVAASLTAFGLVNAGYTNVAVYMGSLQEWMANPDNPMVIGDH